MAQVMGPSGFGTPGKWVKVEEGPPGNGYPLTEYGGGGNTSPLLVLQSLLGPFVARNLSLTCDAIGLTVTPKAATLTPAFLGGGGQASPLLILESLFGETTGIIASPVALTVAVQDTTLRAGRKLVSDTVAYTVTPKDATLTSGAISQGGDASPLLILSTLFTVNPGYKFLSCAPVALTVTPQSAALGTGVRLACDALSYTVSIAPGVSDHQLTADALSLAVSVQTASVYRPYILPLVADAFGMAVSVKDATLYREGADKILPCAPFGVTVSIPDATSLRDYVLFADGLDYAVAIQTAYMPGETVPNEQKYGKSKRRRIYERKYVVEIDGQEFVVNSPESAQDLLEVAVETTKEVASQVWAKPVKAKPPRIRVKGPSGPELDGLVDIVSAARNEIRQLLAEINQVDEIAALIQQQDEEEALIALL